ncbi:MAG: glycosyltransferase family 4 protein, partial [Desulforhopalus sp.]
MKILIVSQYFWPEQFRINDLALALKERGHKVSVLTGVPNYPGGKLFDGYCWWNKRYDDMDGVSVYRTPIFLRRQGRGWQLALNYLSFVFFGCLFGPFFFRKQTFDVIFVYEPSPFTVGIPGVLIRWLKRAPMLFWVQDLWPESLRAAGAVNSPIILRTVGRMVRWIYHRCDRVLVQSEAFVEPAILAGAERRRILYYPNWAESFYRPLAASEITLQGANLPEGFRVVFAGNLGEAQSLETIIDAADRLRGESEIQWIIIGDGRRADWMENEVERLRLSDHVTFLGRYSSEVMPNFFAAADALLVTLKADDVFTQTIPSKVQSYMACGKPILASLNGEGARVIREASAGVVVAAGDAEKLAEAVLELYHMKESDRVFMGEKGRSYYETHFEREMLIRRIERWMQELCEGNNFQSGCSAIRAV